MTGTILNIITVIVGGLIGLFFSGRFPERIKNTLISGIGLFIAGYGFYNFLETNNPLIVLGSLLIGALLGEWWKIEDGLNGLGAFFESRFKNNGKDSSLFIRGFLSASVIFCSGPIAIMGSIQDGLTGDFNILATKAVLDGIVAMVFASSLGVGVIFSVFIILIYQGSISLLANQLNQVVTPAMMAELTAVGGILLLGIAISSLLKIKTIRIGNFIPALFIAPLIVFILSII
ncbi:DUF554 domain-containing protein [Chloroflexota bacterium]